MSWVRIPSGVPEDIFIATRSGLLRLDLVVFICYAAQRKRMDCPNEQSALIHDELLFCVYV